MTTAVGTEPREPDARPGRRLPTNAALLIVACVFVGFSLMPLYIVLTTALKTENAIFSWPPAWRFEPTLESFYNAFFVFGGRSVLLFIFNSVAVTFLSTVAAVTLGAMAAYGLARYPFAGNKHLAFYILSTRFTPPVAFIVPIYLMVQSVGLIDTHIALIVIYTSMNLSFVIWILRGFFMDVPLELEEAALVDGYTRWQIFWRVAVPLVRPGIAATAIISAIFSWTSFCSRPS